MARHRAWSRFGGGPESRRVGCPCRGWQRPAAVQANTTANLATASVINQALGVLLGRGHTVDHAHRALDLQAAEIGTDRHGAAQLLLTTLTGDDPGNPFDGDFDTH